MNTITTLPGDNTGIEFPITVEALKSEGVDFLTRAFQQTGVIDADNAVTNILRYEEFFGGGMGRKVLLTVAYLHDSDDLKKEFFVKFPREFGDPLRDLFNPVMEPEVRFALLTRQPDFPVTVPECYFADFNAEQLCGILITEKIAYGVAPVEPHIDKCLDYTLADPLPYYRALTTAMARLAGYHKAGHFGDSVDSMFPFDVSQVKQTDLIPYDKNTLQQKLEKLKDFAERYPQLLPDHLTDKAFLNDLNEKTPRFLEHELEIKQRLNQQQDYIALCHWNMNVDNAWFWRNTEGELETGLLDWGSVGQMNIAQAFYGMTCGAEADFLNEHKQTLYELFVQAYRDSGGPQLEVATLSLFSRLFVGFLGLAWIIDAPTIIEREIPDLDQVVDRYDSKLKDNFLARAQLQLLTVFLNEWHEDAIAESLDEFLAAFK